MSRPYTFTRCRLGGVLLFGAILAADLALIESALAAGTLAEAAPVDTAAADSTTSDTGEWHPRSEFRGEHDWIQMTSGEWVKGEIRVMYDDSLEFDSDEFGEMTLDWSAIAQIRTSQVMNVGFLGGRSALGTLVVTGDDVVVDGDVPHRTTRDQVLSITAGQPRERNFWKMNVFVGVIVREGNSNVVETNVQAAFRRRTIRDRILVDFVGNQNTTEGEEVADNQRLTAGWDKFISKRFFFKPISGEYFRDPFQNIDSRVTASVGAGYQLRDSRRVDWQVSGGVGYQETRFESTAADGSKSESTPALVASTSADWEVTDRIEFISNYRFQVVNEQSGTYNHHMLLSFETELTRRIDFDVSWIWDRIQDPRPDAAGAIPARDDFRTSVGLSFEF